MGGIASGCSQNTSYRVDEVPRILRTKKALTSAQRTSIARQGEKEPQPIACQLVHADRAYPVDDYPVSVASPPPVAACQPAVWPPIPVTLPVDFGRGTSKGSGHAQIPLGYSLLPVRLLRHTVLRVL